MNEYDLAEKISLDFIQPDLENLIQATVEISAKIGIIFDLDELAERATRLTQQYLGYDQVVLYLCGLEEGVFSLKFIANHRQSQVIKSYDLKNEVTRATVALKERRAVRVHNLPAAAPDELDIFRSELHLPLEHNDQSLGVLSLRCTADNVFDDYKVVALKTLATQLASAIERVRQDTSRSEQAGPEDYRVPVKRPSKRISHILPGFQTLAGIQEVLDRIVNAVVNDLGYVAAMLAVLDEEKQILPVRAVAFNPVIHRLKLLEKAEQLLGIKVIGTYASLVADPDNLGVQSCKTGQIKVSHDLYDLFLPAAGPQLSSWIQRLSGIETCISIPLLIGDSVVGNLFAATSKSKVSQADLDDLQLFVSNAAIAIQNTMLYEEVNHKLAQREAELNQLRGIENTINSSLDLQEVLQRILHGALELTRAEYGHVVLAGRYASDLIHRVSYPELPDSFREQKLGITQSILRDKKPKIINSSEFLQREQQELENLVSLSELPNAKIRSQLGVPISLGEELIGVINIGSQEAGAFNEQSLEMLSQLAVQAAIAITNAHYFKEQQELQKQLANANQVVAMGDIASNMVHSINNWVGSIRADIKYLSDQHEHGEFDQAESPEILADMLKNAEKTLTMAEKIRQPFQQVPSELIDVNECLLNMLLEREEELVDVIVFPELNNLPLIEANQQLQLVFDNLVSNALQAMRDQTRKKILGIATRLAQDRQWVEVVIRDSGPGLPDHFNKEDIFKLGVTSRPEGMGYGLWWCDTFLKRLKGEIRLVGSNKKGCDHATYNKSL
ncbi:MAG: GAF domain-containing protein [Chloroflexi bacterium]|nr:GAF domain-containing protein [Chloroflexota bacterium]